MTAPQDPLEAPTGAQPGQPSYPSAAPGWYPPPGPPAYPQGPNGSAPPPPPPARRGVNWAAVAVLLGIVVVIGGGFWLFRDRLSNSVTSLAVGDCIDEPADTSSVTDVQHQPCNSPHDGEVYYLMTDPGSGDYPGADHFRTAAVSQCVPAAATYLGVSDFAARADIDAGFFYPTSDSWASGDRGVTCYLYRTDRGKLTASLKNIGTSPLP